MKHRGLYYLTLTLLLAVFLFSVWKIVKIQAAYQAGENAYEALDELVATPAPTPAEQTQSDAPEDLENWPEVDFEELAKINPDVVAWIYLEDTQISYPIVQGSDNSYYLKHLFTGEWNDSGCIFLDVDNSSDFSDLHSIVYGHHMKNDTMFSELERYKKPGFYEEHPHALVLTPEGNYRLEFFAGYVADVSQAAWRKNLTPEELPRWVEESKEKSVFDSPVEPSAEDHILTLSTCDYEFWDARFVLAGILEPA